MCGICGVVNQSFDKPVEFIDVKKMCDVITHRGPDEEGQHVDNNVGIGMRRLSIIDLSTGTQPIYNEDKSIVIVFNGEIYNHNDIRHELIAKGHIFKTKSDTETIVHAYEEYGVDCVKKLNGMFGFAIWDNNKKRLFVARDRVGIKPMYYYHDDERLVFGSELKSILQIKEVPREVEPRALDLFLTYEYIPSPWSIFKNIFKLPQAHYLVYENGNVNIQKYWNLEYKTSTASAKDLQENLVELLHDAVKIRLMSEVPLGAFLSGGLDSSTIVALMSRSMNEPVKSFSVGFDDSTYNELPFARKVAEHFKTEHYEEFIKPDAVAVADKIFNILDEPFGDFSVFPTYLVSEMARKHVTVSLSGDGGDELLAGYDTYIAQQLSQKYNKIPAFLRKGGLEPIINMLPPSEKKKGLVNRAKRFIEGERLPKHLQHQRWMIFLQKAEKDMLYSSDFQQSLNGFNTFELMENYFKASNSNDPLDQQEYVDIMTYMVDDILVKVDRMSMAVSLEARVPFLDHRFVEFAATIPSSMRLNGNRTKHILKEAFKDILPDMIINRGKEGFSIPIKNWIKDDLNPLLVETLSDKKVQEAGYFDSTFVNKLINAHIKGKENHSHRLWALTMFHKWMDIYLRDV